MRDPKPIELTSEQYAALSLIRSSQPNSHARELAIQYAMALRIPRHIQASALVGDSDRKIRNAVAKYNAGIAAARQFVADHA